jgi:phosphoheptose isomerase
MISVHASPLAALGGADSGGQNVYVSQIARHLPTLGHRVDVFTRRDSDELPEVIEWSHGARIIHVPAGPTRFVRKEELLQHLDPFVDFIVDFVGREGERYDLLHANFFLSGYVAAELKRRLEIPFVITFHALGRIRVIHQGEADEFPEERGAIEDRIVDEALAIIAECPEEKAQLVEYYGAEPERISLIPGGVDPAVFWPIERKRARKVLGLPDDGPLVLQLGRMVPRKGVENVIRGLAHLVEDHGIPARVVVVGGEVETPDPELTPEIGRLQRVAEEVGVADRVIFTGSRRRDVLRYYYSAADIFVSTPWYEPFGITPLESMACATPVIGARVGGIQYTVVDGETGYLVPARDPTALAQRMADLLTDPEKLRLFGQNGLERAGRVFTWQAVAKQTAELYERVFVERPGAAAESGDETEALLRGFDELEASVALSRDRLLPDILAAAELMNAAFAKGRKVLVAGNGGSAAEALHFAGELVGRWEAPERRALPAIVLGADVASLTAWANDVGYDDVFARQIEAFGHRGDVIVGISTSGSSSNLVEAFKRAGERGLRRVAVVGGDGGALLSLSDVAIVVPCDSTQRIQEIHTLVMHLLCQLIETRFLAEPARESVEEGDDGKRGELSAMLAAAGGDGNGREGTQTRLGEGD